MKAVFMLACVSGAVAWSMVVVLLTRHEQTASDVAAERIAVVTERSPLLPEQSRAVESLLAESIARQETLERQELLLQERQSVVRQEEIVLGRLRDELRALQHELDRRLQVQESVARQNTRKLAEFYARMDAGNAARLLMEMEIAKAAAIVTQLQDRQAAAIMDAAVAIGNNGIKRAVEWAEAIRQQQAEDAGEARNGQ